MSVLRKRDSGPPVVPVAASVGPGSFSAEFPGLWEMLSVEQYPDGVYRRTSTITLFVDQGMSKVCLNDRDNGLTAWATGCCLLDALRALEQALATDTAEWRAAGQNIGKRKKRA